MNTTSDIVDNTYKFLLAVMSSYQRAVVPPSLINRVAVSAFVCAATLNFADMVVTNESVPVAIVPKRVPTEATYTSNACYCCHDQYDA